MKLEINRSEWLRGEGHRDSRLLRHDMKRCCVGIYGRAIGVTDQQMLGKHGPIGSESNAWPQWMRGGEDISDLFLANDGDRTEADRERQVAAIFARHDVEVTFVDGPAPEVNP